MGLQVYGIDQCQYVCIPLHLCYIHLHYLHVATHSSLPNLWVIHTWSLKFSNSKCAFEFIGHPKDELLNIWLHEVPCEKPHTLYWMPQYPCLKCYPHFYTVAIPSTPLTFTHWAEYRPYIHHTPKDPLFPSQNHVTHNPYQRTSGHTWHVEPEYGILLHTFVYSQWMIYVHWNSIWEYLGVPPPPVSASLEFF